MAVWLSTSGRDDLNLRQAESQSVPVPSGLPSPLEARGGRTPLLHLSPGLQLRSRLPALLGRMMLLPVLGATAAEAGASILAVLQEQSLAGSPSRKLRRGPGSGKTRT